MHLDPNINQDGSRLGPRNTLTNLNNLFDDALIISAVTVLKVDGGVASIWVFHDYLVLLVRI